MAMSVMAALVLARQHRKVDIRQVEWIDYAGRSSVVIRNVGDSETASAFLHDAAVRALESSSSDLPVSAGPCGLCLTPGGCAARRILADADIGTVR